MIMKLADKLTRSFHQKEAFIMTMQCEYIRHVINRYV